MAQKLPTVDKELLNITHANSKVIISVDKGSVSSMLGRLDQYKSLPRKFRPALGEVADYVTKEMIPVVFAQEGPGWHKLANRTQMERRMQGYGAQHPILRRTGDLYSELTDRSHPNHVEIIRTGKMARIEIGGSSKKFLENQMGKPSANLPARPMVPGTKGQTIADRDRVAINGIISRAITRMK